MTFNLLLLCAGTILIAMLSLLAYRPVGTAGPVLPGTLLRLLQAAPVLVALVLTGFFLTVINDQYLLRIGHAVLVLGLWMNGTLAVVYTIRQVKAHAPVPVLAAAAVVPSLPPAIYLTPYPRHQAVFGAAVAPLVAGLVLVAVAYWCLHKLSA